MRDSRGRGQLGGLMELDKSSKGFASATRMSTNATVTLGLVRLLRSRGASIGRTSTRRGNVQLQILLRVTTRGLPEAHWLPVVDAQDLLGLNYDKATLVFAWSTACPCVSTPSRFWSTCFLPCFPSWLLVSSRLSVHMKQQILLFRPYHLWYGTVWEILAATPLA
jgi:hypothetical protein